MFSACVVNKVQLSLTGPSNGEFAATIEN